MEITTMQMYWLVILDNIIGVLIAILGICAIFFILGTMTLFAMGKEEQVLPIAKKILFVAATALLLLIFVPSTKKMAAIIVVPKIANSEKVQTIGNKVYDLAVEWMEELRPPKGIEAK